MGNLITQDSILQITVDTKQVLERFDIIQRSTKSKIVPVLKNNSNSLGFIEMVKLFENKCSRIATAYAHEWFKYPDANVEKFSWTWVPNDKYKTLPNLILVCKNWKQLDFCIKNNIRYFCEFNIAMNRGGFLVEDIPKLRDIITDKTLNVMAHCPFEQNELLSEYEDKVNKLLECVRNYFELGEVTVANSFCTYNDPNLHFDFCRCGELLLLPHRDKFSKEYRPVEISTFLYSTGAVKAKDWVGYHMVQVQKDCRIGVLPVGYYNLEVENLNKVLLKLPGKDVLCDVLCSMHDTTIIEIPDDIDDSYIGSKVVLLDLDLMEHNWNRCIQKTFKINQDMVDYLYL